MRFQASLAAALTTALLLGVSVPAQAATIFQFSFINTIGTVPGTVTGRILGLADDGIGPASQVLIDSFPVGLNNIAGPAPIDAMFWDQQGQNSFTTVAGQVVGGGFWATQTVNLFPAGFQLYINGTPSGFNFLNLDGDDALYVWGDSGFAAANIIPVASAVSEPATLLLLGTGLGAVAARRRMTKRS